MKHMLDKKAVEFYGISRYLCNQAVFPTFEKLTTKLEDVTCKNCLKQKLKIN